MLRGLGLLVVTNELKGCWGGGSFSAENRETFLPYRVQTHSVFAKIRFGQKAKNIWTFFLKGNNFFLF